MSTSPTYDVVVVGARVAGAATAMLLARQGLRVLMVDRSRYGSDTVSTHALMRAGVLQLRRWGLLGQVVAAGAPAVRRTVFHHESGDIPVSIKPAAGVTALYAPRRTTLDALLVDAAVDAGAEARFGVKVTGLLRDEHGRVSGVTGRGRDGSPVSIRAAVTVGADGLHSTVASAVAAPVERRAANATAVLYGYWPGVEPVGYEWFYGRQAGAGFIPTEGGLTVVFAGTSPGRFRRLGGRATDRFSALLDLAAPGARDRVVGAPVGGLRGFPGSAAYLRRAWGPGWALVGDAGYFKDPITAHGITDALRDAELLARAIGAAVRAEASWATALGGYQALRDRLSLPLFDVTDRVASYDWDEPTLHRDLLAVSSAMSEEVEVLHDLAPLGLSRSRRSA
jgi:2-polyprenyl-6-methoxyphenol hydroxylase-like FAD-dependent oxidoreductase